MSTAGTSVYTADVQGERVDAFLARKSAEDGDSLSRSGAAKLCEEGRVTVGAKTVKKNYSLSEGDTVVVVRPEPLPDEVLPEDIPLDVIYEDGDIIVVNKPKGMVVHPAPGNMTGTLVSALLYRCGESLSGIGGVCRPGIVHRIDKDTSGLLVVAKNDAAHRSLSEQIAVHSARRTYLALVVGSPREDEGTVDAPIGRHPVDRKRMAIVRDGHARDAVTHWHVVERFHGISLVECKLETGRTHQIRVHMSSIGHPVLGDEVYGGDKCRAAKAHAKYICGQCLHAYRLELDHPRTGERMTFEAPMPDDMAHLIEIFRQEL
ncbi:MAG: RluA family pseudouridine synthase [Eubacteriales bacterium]